MELTLILLPLESIAPEVDVLLLLDDDDRLSIFPTGVLAAATAAAAMAAPATPPSAEAESVALPAPSRSALLQSPSWSWFGVTAPISRAISSVISSKETPRVSGSGKAVLEWMTLPDAPLKRDEDDGVVQISLPPPLSADGLMWSPFWLPFWSPLWICLGLEIASDPPPPSPPLPLPPPPKMSAQPPPELFVADIRIMRLFIVEIDDDDDEVGVNDAAAGAVVPAAAIAAAVDEGDDVDVDDEDDKPEDVWNPAADGDE